MFVAMVESKGAGGVRVVSGPTETAEQARNGAARLFGDLVIIAPAGPSVVAAWDPACWYQGAAVVDEFTGIWLDAEGVAHVKPYVPLMDGRSYVLSAVYRHPTAVEADIARAVLTDPRYLNGADAGPLVREACEARGYHPRDIRQERADNVARGVGAPYGWSIYDPSHAWYTA